jgi:hypothetical protein
MKIAEVNPEQTTSASWPCDRPPKNKQVPSIARDVAKLLVSSLVLPPYKATGLQACHQASSIPLCHANQCLAETVLACCLFCCSVP